MSGPSADAESPEAVRELADAENAEAQWRMGVRCHTGAGVRQDDREAVQWFLRAAEQGHITAQATLGAYYGLGVEFPKISPGMHALRVWRFCRMIKIPIAFRRGTATLPG